MPSDEVWLDVRHWLTAFGPEYIGEWLSRIDTARKVVG
jgi:hypothetical protein